MTNLIRGHIYQLKKDRFFYGCLGIGLIFLAVSIRIFLLGFTSDTGMTSMMQTFLGGDMVLYAFMVLAANIIAEVYRSGAMKNIVGRGISKKSYYLSMVFTISGAYVLVMLVLSIFMGIFAMSKYGMGTLEYPAYFALSIVAKILFVMAHISFAVTMAVLTQNVITGAIFGFLVPYRRLWKWSLVSLRFISAWTSSSFLHTCLLFMKHPINYPHFCPASL